MSLEISTMKMTTPLGPLRLLANRDGLVAVLMKDQERAGEGGVDAVSATGHILESARAELEAYFAGKQVVFTTPLFIAGTAFQERVWAALREIPYGETRTYGQLAARIGKPSAVRAVGAANGKNPLGIIVPCHRVIGASGSLTGYAGGLDNKRWLLAHEGALLL